MSRHHTRSSQRITLSLVFLFFLSDLSLSRHHHSYTHLNFNQFQIFFFTFYFVNHFSRVFFLSFSFLLPNSLKPCCCHTLVVVVSLPRLAPHTHRIQPSVSHLSTAAHIHTLVSSIAFSFNLVSRHRRHSAARFCSTRVLIYLSDFSYMSFSILNISYPSLLK